MNKGVRKYVCYRQQKDAEYADFGYPKGIFRRRP
jgi:hypothetical protein